MPGQSSEEAAELVATIRGEHVVMKTWFMGPSDDAKQLRDKYGPYPGLWKEVLNWPGWKEARRAYLKSTQNGDSSKSSMGGEIPRKRRSRWGNADNSDTNAPPNNNSQYSNEGRPSDNEPPQKQRRSRWGRDQDQQQQSNHYQPQPGRSQGGVRALPGLGLPGMPQNLTPQQQDEFRRHQTRLREINTKLDNLEREAARVDALPRGHRERSPSPPPVYGADGKRKNTRAVRWRQRYTAERQDILEKLMNLNPAARQSGLFKRKRTKKVRIPVEEHPQYNFIGLIIGPRGKTQKELEAKTGCKIAIRGRGSVKEGARGRRDGKVMESDDEPLHVVITGDDQRSVDAATDMIEQMLVVIDDEKNVHKQQQLRELALLNGTLKEEEYCSICGEKGHRAFECPKRFAMRKNAVQIRCAICGSAGHPTRDCTQKPNAQEGNTKEMDSDYMSFMAELDGKKAEQAAPNAPPGAPQVEGGDVSAAAALPPPPSGASNLPLPPAGGPPPPPGGAPLPPIQGAAPPAPAASGSYYGNQQHYGNHYQQQGQHYQQQQQQHYQQQGSYYGSQNNPGPAAVQGTTQQWQQQQQQGWDYQSYYGGGNGAGGAGGFNWWENN